MTCDECAHNLQVALSNYNPKSEEVITMAKSKAEVINLGFIGRMLLNKKLKSPRGVTLSRKESAVVISNWKDESSTVLAEEERLVIISNKMQTRKITLAGDIKKSASKLRADKENYKKEDSPVRKSILARKLIASNRYHEHLRTSQHNMDATIQRVKDTIEDAQVVRDIYQNRIRDAEIYRELNKGLTLVGQSLMDAKEAYKLPQIEYENLEWTMEQIEEQVSDKDHTGLILEADSIITGSSRNKKNTENIEEAEVVDNKKK